MPRRGCAASPIRVVSASGAAAGGGFPQWNCSCRNCADVRAGKPGFRPRTQCSLAVSANGSDWVLLNTAPDLRQQINIPLTIHRFVSQAKPVGVNLKRLVVELRSQRGPVVVAHTDIHPAQDFTLAKFDVTQVAVVEQHGQRPGL